MTTFRTRPLIVVDTNTIVRAFANRESPSGIVVNCCQNREVPLLLSGAVLQEYHKVLNYPDLKRRNPSWNPDRVEVTLRALRYISDFRRQLRVRFEFPRDPDDQKFLELALAGPATHIVTLDRDLLSLPQSYDEAAKRLRQRLPLLRIVSPLDFLHDLEGYRNLN
jgi:uncharacterized protein